MSDNIIKNTCQTLTLPLYAMIHDSVVQALKASRVARPVALAIIEQIPKVSVSANEQKELEKAQGLIQLEDSFGSGNFYIIDAGSNQALVCTEQKHADYLDQLMKSHSDQDFLPKDQSDDQQNKNQNNNQNNSQNQVQNQMPNQMQNQNQSQQNQMQNQSQQNQPQDQDVLLKLQVIDWILKGNEQKQKQGTIKVGQTKQNNDQNFIQKMALFEIMQGKDATEVLKNMQMLHMMEDLSGKQNLNQGHFNLF
ncbi:hypothetical protein LSG31_11945 [Fodinisporobacter ferrooxydans]|uniref:Uncharacterized protein n=1 Tax=Fodinisporobacter ferrooxydans TaxID=2901836 RepID=A0ABY4CEC9_9BACL|nr:hypothetical protein LSG31_11945 [Alicyclobacillaceae bacterium MYW30-H2]